jgi:hypothetical protein
MTFPRLGTRDGTAAVAAAVTVIGAGIAGGAYPGHWGVTWLAAFLGIGMLAVILLPNLSPTTRLPDTKGRLMAIAGATAALLMAFVFLTNVSFTFQDFDFPSLCFLVAVGSALVMARSGWQALQAEGGWFGRGRRPR